MSEILSEQWIWIVYPENGSVRVRAAAFFQVLFRITQSSAQRQNGIFSSKVSPSGRFCFGIFILRLQKLQAAITSCNFESKTCQTMCFLIFFLHFERTFRSCEIFVLVVCSSIWAILPINFHLLFKIIFLQFCSMHCLSLFPNLCAP